METKLCPRCDKELDFSHFHKNKNTKTGYSSWCKPCAKIHGKKMYEKRRDHNVLSGLKNRASKKNVPFDLKVEDLVFPETCPILGINLYINKSYHGPSKNSPSVDRIDPAKGYVKGNIQIISHLANAMKQNATPEELVLFAKWVIKTYGEPDETDSKRD